MGDALTSQLGWVNRSHFPPIQGPVNAWEGGLAAEEVYKVGV